MSHIAFKRFRLGGAQSVPDVEAFLGKLENWLDEAGLRDVSLSMDIQEHGGKGAPQVISLVLAPGRPGAASLSIGVCAWPDNEVEYYLSIGADRDILSTAIDDRLVADSLLAICEAVAGGRLCEQRLTMAGKVIGHRAAVPYGHAGIIAQRTGLAGLRLDRVIAALGIARFEEIHYPAWKVI
ncbi:MAG: hypothetical protein KAJ11_13630 [Alphaproteobacteria bacterium]|nr:hypothetical protein [Alphaproteobacteria bacterium]